MSVHLTTEAQKALADLATAMIPNVEAVRESLVKLAGFIPEGGWVMRKKGNPYYETGDEHAPLMSEGCTYNLCGKEDGRTMLALFNEICRSVHLDPHEIRMEVARRQEAQAQRQRDLEAARETRRATRGAVR